MAVHTVRVLFREFCFVRHFFEIACTLELCPQSTYSLNFVKIHLQYSE